MKTEPCTLYVVRHGQAELNRDKIVMGQLDSKLTELGREQATKLNKTFKNIHFDAVLVSDLQRATETARIITGTNGSAFIIDKRLRERNFGHLEGLAQSELQELRKNESGLTPLQQWQQKISDDIESDEEVFQRAHECLVSNVTIYPSKTLLVVTHSGPIRTLLMGLGFFEQASLQPGAINNGQYCVLKMSSVSANLIGIYPENTFESRSVTE